MSENNRKLCIVCAWRANCAKRFSMGDDATLHCPDFSEDVTLRKRPAEQQPSPEEKGPKE
jgi:hypothetical protein